MIRGLSFEIPQQITDTLWKILSAADISKYFWYCDQSQTEVWGTEGGNDFFSQEFYDGESFSKHIQLVHHIIFLKLQARFTPQHHQNIHSYDAFASSDCQLLMLVNDCVYVEIYIKDQSVIDAIFERAKLLGYSKIKYITSNNDVRTKMDVL